MWRFDHRRDRTRASARAKREEAESRLRNLQCRELDLLCRLDVLHERHELYPQEVGERQVVELDRKLDELRAQIATIHADLSTDRRKL